MYIHVHICEVMYNKCLIMNHKIALFECFKRFAIGVETISRFMNQLQRKQVCGRAVNNSAICTTETIFGIIIILYVYFPTFHIFLLLENYLRVRTINFDLLFQVFSYNILYLIYVLVINPNLILNPFTILS